MQNRLTASILLFTTCATLGAPRCLLAQDDSLPAGRAPGLMMKAMMGGALGAAIGALVGPSVFRTPCDRQATPCSGPAFITNGGAGGMLLGSAAGSSLAAHLANGRAGNLWQTAALSFVAGVLPVAVADGAQSTLWLAGLVPLDAWIASRFEARSAESRRKARASTLPRPPLHDRWWFSARGGGGGGQIDCSACGPLTPDDPWRGGSGYIGSAAVGGTISPRLLVGMESTVWMKEDLNYQVGGRTIHRRASIFSMLGVVQAYPSALPFFLKAGAGVGFAELAGGGGPLVGAGFAGQVGAGVDVRVSDKVAISPFVEYLGVQTNRFTGNNFGQMSQGPPRVSVIHGGVAIAWY